MVAHEIEMEKSMLENITMQEPIKMAKKIYRFTQGTATEKKEMLKDEVC